jgi:hypothetical protein
MSTRLQVRTAVRRRIGNRPVSEFSDADLDKWLDDGLLDFATRRVHLRSLEALETPVVSAVGVSAYAIPITVFSVHYLEDTANTRILRRFPGGFSEYLESKQNASDGVPSQFVEYGSNFYVGPDIPQASDAPTWQPYVYNRPTWGPADGNSPDIEAEMHYGVELVATMHGFREIGDEERATEVENELNAWLNPRDTPRRQSARFERPQAGIRPSAGLRSRRTGV